MARMEEFVREETLPSWWTNRIQDRIAALTNLRLRKASATTIESVVQTSADQDRASVININGRWRFNTATISRAHPGGAAGTYLVFVTAQANDIRITPVPYSDFTVYTYALAIVPNGQTPGIVAGVVDIFARVGSLVWDGAAITSLTQEVGIGPSVITTEFLADGSVSFVKVASGAIGQGAGTLAAGDDSRFPTSGQKSALVGTSGSPGSGNKYVTDADGRLPSVGESDALVGYGGTPSAANPYVTQAALAGLGGGGAGGPHETTHLPNGSDALPWLASIHRIGTLGSRPAAGADNAGLHYFGSNDHGGMLRESTGSDWVAIAPPPTGGAARVTSLPNDPYDGQEVVFVASATDGVLWRLRWKDADAKWEFVGGSDLFSEVAADEARANAAFGDLATAGPSVTIPIAGTYKVEFGCNMHLGVVAAGFGVMSYKIGATEASDADSVVVGSFGSGGTENQSSVSRTQHKTFAAGAVLLARYRSDSGNGRNFRWRWMRVCPVKLG